MGTIKDDLKQKHDDLAAYEAKLRDRFENKNIADIVRDAVVKLDQATQHPQAGEDMDAKPVAPDEDVPLSFSDTVPKFGE